jgi:hypothetical protein
LPGRPGNVIGILIFKKNPSVRRVFSFAALSFILKLKSCGLNSNRSTRAATDHITEQNKPP